MLGLDLFIFYVGCILTNAIFKPLQKLSSLARRIGEGDFLETVDIPKSNDEIGVLADSFHIMVNRLEISREELKNKALSLEKSNRELKETTANMIQSEKLTALGELSAGVSHELMQPLNGIKIISQSIVKEIRNDRFQGDDLEDDLSNVVGLVDKMAEIINHMRVFSRRTEEGQKETVDLNTTITGPLKFLDQQMKNHNIKITQELEQNLPKIMADPIRLEQVFMNLITNAGHSLEGDKIEEKTIVLKTYKANSRHQGNMESAVIAEVKDNGAGIPEEIREKIFQAFFTTRESGKGTGLGLSLSRKIIEEHEGEIECESVVGEGTVFRVTIPCVERFPIELESEQTLNI